LQPRTDQAKPLRNPKPTVFGNLECGKGLHNILQFNASG
jgi:hypothetical protein